jgi:hypothetical protein
MQQHKSYIGWPTEPLSASRLPSPLTLWIPLPCPLPTQRIPIALVMPSGNSGEPIAELFHYRVTCSASPIPRRRLSESASIPGNIVCETQAHYSMASALHPPPKNTACE